MAKVEIIEAKFNNNIKNSVNKTVKKVCAYCRVSTDSEEQLTSYISQIKHYSEQIKKNPEWKFVGIYADEGISGTQVKNRTEFMRMIDDAIDGKIDVIIAKSISRFARNTLDTLKFVRLLREHNVDVYFEKENIHTLELDSEMFLTLYSAFAQAESESTSMNVKLGYKAKMKRGEPCGLIGCYGYIWDKNSQKLVINDKEAKIVKKIFKYYIEGYGSTAIAKKLMAEKIPSPNGKTIWHPSVIKTIIRNVKYVGDICGQKYFVENPISHRLLRNRGQKPMYYVREHHDAIIDREAFDKAQKIYQSRSVKIKDGKVYCEKYSLRYTFSSMIYCESCGKTFVRRHSIHKNKDGVVHDHIYWACSSRVARHKDKWCDISVTIREEEIKSLFVGLFNKFLNQSRNDELIKKIKNVIAKDNSEEKLNAIDKKILSIKDRMAKLIDLNINQLINEDVFLQKNQELNAELLNLQSERNEVLNSKKYIQKEEKRLREIEKELDKSSTIRTFDDEIFKKLISKVIIGDYDENNNYDPNVIKFVLNIKNVGSDDMTKFLSLELDERVHTPIKMSQLGGMLCN